MNSRTNQYTISIEKQKEIDMKKQKQRRKRKKEGEKESINISHHINKLKKKNCMILLVNTEKTFDKI